MKIKICGITNLEDALLAVREGAWAVGMVRFEGSPRLCELEDAVAIGTALKRKCELVGVYVNATFDQIAHEVDQIGLTMVQLHGDEGPAFVEEVKRRTGVKVIKAARVKDRSSLAALKTFNADFYMLDAFKEGVYGGTGEVFDWTLVRDVTLESPVILSGGLTPESVGKGIAMVKPDAVDVSSGIELEPGKKDVDELKSFFAAVGKATPDVPDHDKDRQEVLSIGPTVATEKIQQRFGPYGGRYVPETLMPALEQLDCEFRDAMSDGEFRQRLDTYLQDYAGRPTPLYRAERLSDEVGCTVYLKREDLLHTGAHKINNALGQALLAKRMGKGRIIAETGAGQHGVAVATVCALFDLECVIYMGVEDMRRQAPNVERMKMLDATVEPVEAGTKTLKDATSQAIRDWVANVENTHYLIGSVVGPAPFPEIVRDFQRVIGDESRVQIEKREGRLPDLVVACVGGGSNAIGTFTAYLDDEDVGLVGGEAAGKGLDSGEHGASLVAGSDGVLHGSFTRVLQDGDGQIIEAHSVSAGLDYPGVGPEHAFLRQSGRVRYEAVTDDQAVAAYRRLNQLEGILPALEPAHAIAWLFEQADLEGKLVVLCLSGRGDKDLAEVLAYG